METESVKVHPRWRGVIRSLRLDPCSTGDVTIAISSVKFVGTYASSPLW